MRRRSHHRRSLSHGASQRHPELQTEDSPSVAAILVFPDETNSFHRNLRLVQYDYVFDVAEDSRLDALTVSIGASHPMLRGGTMVTTIFDSIYAFGSVSARENSILDPNEMQRKRNILRHLPALDFQFGIQNIYIPPESESYSDDGHQNEACFRQSVVVATFDKETLPSFTGVNLLSLELQNALRKFRLFRRFEQSALYWTGASTTSKADKCVCGDLFFN